MIQSISGGVAASTALGIAVTMNVVQDAIAESQNEQGQESGSTTSQSQTTEVSGSVAIPNNGQISLPSLIPSPIEKSKGLGGNILWIGGNEGGSNADVVEVEISRSKYPESAKHIEDAIANGQPDVLTINRTGAKPNRRASLK